MAWSLRDRRSGIGSDSRRSAGERAEEIGDGDKRGHGYHGLVDQHHGRAVLARCHPVRQETPRLIGELAAEAAAAVDRPLVTRDRQRLADERMPAVVDGDRAWKLRSM
jgi:hypothetical protein